MGRASTYDQSKAEEICHRIADGEPLRQICRIDGMPAWRTVYDWIREHPDFAASIARARETGFHAIAEECLEIADDSSRDSIETEAGEKPNTEYIARSKIRIETRLKLLAKWSPKLYGDKVALEHMGQDGGPIQVTTIRILSGDD